METFPKSIEDLRVALPDIAHTVHLASLETPVEIFRDRYGIPHVRAQSAYGAFFGQGFATAQDRLWHMDHDRRWAYGTWAEYAGQRAIEQDLTMRRFQIRSSVEDDYRAVNSETKEMMDAYSAGVNAFILSTTTLPIEYSLLQVQPDPWQPWDCFAVFKARHILMGVFESKLWRARLVKELGAEEAAKLLPGYQKGHLLIAPTGAEQGDSQMDALFQLSAGAEAIESLTDTDGGSNSWALSGSRTESGKPLLAGDPHRGLDTPNVYYQNHISCEEFDVIGLSFPGCPGFPHFGHNSQVAWCVTHAGSDYQDLYVEKFKKGSSSLYEFEKKWEQADVRRETIKVRDSEEIEFDVIVTHHGPIIVGDPTEGYGVAFKYTATSGPNVGLQPLRKMLRVSSIEDMDDSMRDWTDPCNSFVFIDVHGGVKYLNRGKLPIRPIANAWLPVPGWIKDYEWSGFVPFEELPRIENPEEGFIVTANNKIVGDDYPYYIALNFGTEYRARRIYERLKTLNKATALDMAEVHAEKGSIPASIYVPLFLEVTPLDAISARAQARLLEWDFTMDRDSVSPTIYSAIRIELEKTILRHLLGPLGVKILSPDGRGAPFHVHQLRSLLLTQAQQRDSSHLPEGKDWSMLLAEALKEGVNYLQNCMGPDMDNWVWGNIHSTRPVHPLSLSFPDIAPLLDPPSFPMGGDGDTPQSAGYSISDPFYITATSVARYVFDAGDWSNCGWIVPLGSSGHPGSVHYADQAKLWSELQLVPMLYEWDSIVNEAESSQKLVPISG